MKNPFYVIETFHATSGWDMPEWHKVTTHATLKAALEKKTKMLAIKGKDYTGKPIQAWYAKEIRIVEHARKVVG